MIRIDLNVFKETWNNQSSKNSFENNRSGGGKGSRRTTRGEIHPRRYVPTGTKKERKNRAAVAFQKLESQFSRHIWPWLDQYLRTSGLRRSNIGFDRGLVSRKGASWQNRDVTRQPVQTEVCIFRGTVVAILEIISTFFFLLTNYPFIREYLYQDSSWHS